MSSEPSASIGIFGGTGLYDSNVFSDTKEIDLETPFGRPSDSVTVGTLDDKKVAFLPRHGKKHTIPPHMINYRANIWAFKKLGVERILAPSAVGSLKEHIMPGHFALPSQFVDYTKTRKGTFYEDEKVIHISVADPFCPQLQQCVKNTASQMGVTLHEDCNYVCIDGPRFSTKAESRFYKKVIGADIIGMTVVPEAQLAREAQICYVSISTITDYDVWAEKPVTANQVKETLSKNVKNLRKVLESVSSIIPETRSCSCKQALEEGGL